MRSSAEVLNKWWLLVSQIALWGEGDEPHDTDGKTKAQRPYHLEFHVERGKSQTLYLSAPESSAVTWGPCQGES